MTPEELREQAIQNVANSLRNQPFSVEFKVKKKPKGIKIIYEVTKEELDILMRKAAERR